MLKKQIKGLLSVLVCALVLASPFITTAAEKNSITIKEENLTISLPGSYTMLNADNAKKNKEIIEDFGYSVTSFKSYLKSNNIILFASDKESKAQVSVKKWESDFSKDVQDLAYLSDKSLESVVKELIKDESLAHKTVTINGMKMFEIQKNDKDSGGDFCSAQYVTIRNGNFYSVTVMYPGKMDDEKASAARKILLGLNIKNKTGSSGIDFSSIIEIVLIWVLIVVAVVAIGIIIFSFYKDIKKKNADDMENKSVIKRRKGRHMK